MPRASKLDRPVRPRAEDLIESAGSDEEDFEGFDEDEDDSSPSVIETGEGGDILSSDEGSDASDDEPEPSAQDQLKSVSFGTLAKAQDAVSRKRKRGSDTNDDQERKLDALRARLAEIKAAKSNEAQKRSKSKTTKAKEDKSNGGLKSASDDDSHSDSASGSDDDDGAGPKSRSSKHAPTAQSTKYQVTRRRNVVHVPKSQSRDPRFDPTWMAKSESRSAVNGNTEKAYAFLREYEDGEMGELRTAIKKSKNEGEKDTLQRKLMSMQNRRKASVAKERERDVIREHRKKERDAVKEGKKPFYLKDKDIRKEAEAKRVEGMKKGDRVKAEARKKKRESQREMKSMPAPRRIA